MTGSLPENPCASCSTNQHCCSRLSGLILAQDEFNKLFKSRSEALSVRRAGKVVIVSAADGGACPYWGKGGCRIYRDRPIDCRIFPYILTRVIERRKSVKIIFHTRTDCPRKDVLYALMPLLQAKALAAEFGQKAYRGDKTINVQCQKGPVSRFLNRIESALSRFRFK